MGNFVPVTLAFLLNLCGVSVFRELKTPGTEPLISSMIFLTALYILLIELRLYPTGLRKLWRCGTVFINFTVATFLMELLMNDFWWPLEASFILFLPKVADFEQQILSQSGLRMKGVLQVLRNDVAAIAASYLLSLFFLLSSLHATRVIDLRLLKCGPGVFLGEVVATLQKMKRRALKSIGLQKKRVRFCAKFAIPPDFGKEFYNETRMPTRRRRRCD